VHREGLPTLGDLPVLVICDSLSSLGDPRVVTDRSKVDAQRLPLRVGLDVRGGVDDRRVVKEREAEDQCLPKGASTTPLP